jgi:hypothetical protein
MPPTPPQPGDNPYMCPVCGWRPCTDCCRLAINGFDMEIWADRFPEFFSEEEITDE